MAAIGFGSKLEVDDGASSAFVAFETRQVSIPKADLEYIDASYLNMGDRYRRYVAGLIAPGDMTFEVLYTKDDLTRLYALRATTKNYKITFPDASTVTFAGILQNAEMDVTVDQVMVVKGSVRVTGAITFTEGA